MTLRLLSQEHIGDQRLQARFERQGRLLALCSHPNIVSVFTWASGVRTHLEERTPVLVLEHLEGGSMRQLVNNSSARSNKQLFSQRAEALIQICAGVAGAHKVDIVHRNLTPDCCLYDPHTKQWKIADFGLAYATTRDPAEAQWATRSKMTMGTVAYMAPEQRRDAGRVRHSADVYALGRIAYELFTEGLPDGHYPPASQLEPRLSAQFDQVIERCLNPEPDARYPSAQALYDALIDALNSP